MRFFGELDARTRILTVAAVTVIVVSTPPGALLPFAAYLPLSLMLIATGRAPGGYLARRCLAASPFILLAAGLLAVQGGSGMEGLRAYGPPAISVAGKGFTAAALLSFLTATTPLSELLPALRRLKAPASLNLILGLMHRYTGLLSEEYARMARARESRTAGPLGNGRYRLYGRQLGALVLRSWDRAERVHAAMLARGFDGVWPDARRTSFGWPDVAVFSVSCAAFLAARLML
jgi:cobalt/nickel transport system permease protein